ncbi:hypothetical protein PIROE2DRAFT_1773 [Piromyces sp. E2]|nr:hypothetical protein PIROE2DRAFT_1773 [Piromyces sp. E2]|eukprot:OUM70095.1 hypothetical protein PIROE2DRAFT_1773 [Piromyces sp. E2]
MVHAVENSGNNSGNNSSENELNNSYSEISNNSDRKCSKVFNFLLSDVTNAIIIETKLNGKICVIIDSKSGIPLKVTKSANADNTVRQASSANDPISAYCSCYSTDRN